MDDQKLFNKFVDFFRESLEDGWVKDLLSWVFWGIGISTLLAITKFIDSISFRIFSMIIFILWFGLGFAIFDKIQDFFITYINKHHNKGIKKRFIFSILFVIGSLFMFYITFTSMNELIRFFVDLQAQKTVPFLRKN